MRGTSRKTRENKRIILKKTINVMKNKNPTNKDQIVKDNTEDITKILKTIIHKKQKIILKI